MCICVCHPVGGDVIQRKLSPPSAVEQGDEGANVGDGSDVFVIFRNRSISKSHNHLDNCWEMRFRH